MLLKVCGLEFSYEKSKPILNGVSLELGATAAIGITGANGSGKTTFFRCLTGLEKTANGHIEFCGKVLRGGEDYAEARRQIGFALQNADNQIIFPTVMEDVMFGPLNLGLDGEEADKRAHYWLERLGIGDFGGKITANLSGGEKKLVALAGILAMRPKLLLLDEPLNELDSDARKRLVTILNELECAKIVASHESGIFESLGCERLRLENGALFPDTRRA